MLLKLWALNCQEGLMGRGEAKLNFRALKLLFYDSRGVEPTFLQFKGVQICYFTIFLEIKQVGFPSNQPAMQIFLTKMRDGDI